MTLIKCMEDDDWYEPHCFGTWVFEDVDNSDTTFEFTGMFIDAKQHALEFAEVHDISVLVLLP